MSKSTVIAAIGLVLGFFGELIASRENEDMVKKAVEEEVTKQLSSKEEDLK